MCSTILQLFMCTNTLFIFTFCPVLFAGNNQNKETSATTILCITGYLTSAGTDAMVISLLTISSESRDIAPFLISSRHILMFERHIGPFTHCPVMYIYLELTAAADNDAVLLRSTSNILLMVGSPVQFNLEDRQLRDIES